MTKAITLQKYIALQIKAELDRHKEKKAGYNDEIMKLANTIRLARKENKKLYKAKKPQREVGPFLNQLKELVDEKNKYLEKGFLNQIILAQKTGLSEPYVSQICQGKANLKIELVEKLQDALGIQFDFKIENLKK